jgi:para-aminobenzoate synthetase/4-amino-4-deoxychorismate lyase
MSDSSLIQDSEAGGWWRFRDARDVVVATRIEEVLPALQNVERRVEREHLWAAGFIAYEAGPAFDVAIRSRPPGSMPLLWMSLFPEPRLVQLPERPAQAEVRRYAWKPSVERNEYERAIARIRELIAAGDTYQVNYTLRLLAPAVEEPQALFLRMVAANRPLHAAYLDCGRFAVCSASPELFFRLEKGALVSRPMKGTAGRGLWLEQDKAKGAELAASQKNRAENTMIVDMVRNDVSRVSQTGSVRVAQLFELERYPTLWQMTSTVTARSTASTCDILQALFPPASITGAPKIRATQIIADLEPAARGVYTGCIGYLAPGRRAKFNVAIRTAIVDRVAGNVEYGVGGGIVWDSTSQSEYEECLLKARIVTDTPPPFALLETLLWEPGSGWFLLDEHLRRLAESADYFDARVDIPSVRERLDTLARTFDAMPQRVRLIVARNGSASCDAAPLTDPGTRVRLALAAAPIDPGDPFLYNKTTHRKVYEEAKAARPDCDDVVLWNGRGEATETTIANLVVERDGRRITPPVECGLLPGVFRAYLLVRGEIAEARVTLDELRRASRIWTINSVRKWREAELIA